MSGQLCVNAKEEATGILILCFANSTAHKFFLQLVCSTILTTNASVRVLICGIQNELYVREIVRRLVYKPELLWKAERAHVWQVHDGTVFLINVWDLIVTSLPSLTEPTMISSAVNVKMVSNGTPS